MQISVITRSERNRLLGGVFYMGYGTAERCKTVTKKFLWRWAIYEISTKLPFRI